MFVGCAHEEISGDLESPRREGGIHTLFTDRHVGKHMETVALKSAVIRPLECAGELWEGNMW